MVPHAVYRMDDLTTGTTFTGPAIVDQVASTLVIGAGGRATVDRAGWVIVELPRRAVMEASDGAD